MKKYIGTKVIKAEPMTVTEAQVLGVEIKPATVWVVEEQRKRVLFIYHNAKQ